MNRWEKDDTQTQWSIILPSKEGNLAIYDNMDGPWWPYARWNQSERERQIPYDLTYLCNLKQTEAIKLKGTENRYAVAKGRSMGGQVDKMGKRGQIVQTVYTNSIKWISRVPITYSMVTIVNNTLLHIWKLPRDYVSKVVPMGKNFFGNYARWGIPTRRFLLIVLQCRQITNHYVVHLKPIHCCVTTTSESKQAFGNVFLKTSSTEQIIGVTII